MTIDQNSKQQDNLRYGLRFAPTRLAHGNSRFCFLKVTKPVNEHHLQVTRTASQTCFLLQRDFKSITTTNNTDGMGNCLQQPGQLHNRPQKSMRETASQLNKLCVP